MKSLSKALLIITCLVCACRMVLETQVEIGLILIIFGGLVAVFYDTPWK